MAALVQTRQGLVARHSELMTTYSEATARAESYRDGMAKKVGLNEEVTTLTKDTEAGNLDEEMSARQQRIDRGQAFRVAIANFNTLQAQFQITQEKLAAAELEVLIYDALQKALAPDGIPSQMIAEALDGINELLDEAASYLFTGRYLHLTGELGIVLQNSPYQTLSKSAKYRVGVAFQYALARLTGARILLIDEADILDREHQELLSDFLIKHLNHFDQIIVFTTTDRGPLTAVEKGAGGKKEVWPFGDFHEQLQTWWLDRGQITKVAA